MKITKLQIENLYGIEQLELDGKSIELTGTNGAGKSSVLDAIRLALTNNSKRKYVVKNGETEGRVLVKLDDGTTIDRKKRTDRSDYKSVKDQNGNEINSPETFLKDIFTPLQLEPVEFLSMSEKEQNRILLNLIEFNRDKKEFINEKFGEVPSWVDYDESILEILNQLQAKEGQYYQTREEVNRQIKNGLAVINDISKNIPEGYDESKWRNYTLSDKYEELSRLKTHNANIDKSIAYKENYENAVNALKAKLDSSLAMINNNKADRKRAINANIADLRMKITLLEKDLENVDNEFLVDENKAKADYEQELAKLSSNIEIAYEWIAKPKVVTEDLENELKVAEEMKGHLNEYDRMVEKQVEVDGLSVTSQALTDKIELARNLPGEILKEANIPVKNLTVVNGVPLVNGLTISNLSEGEKLMLCVDVTLSNPNSLKLILIDGVERLSEANRNELYKICKEKGLQCIATRTTDNNELTIVEL